MRANSDQRTCGRVIQPMPFTIRLGRKHMDIRNPSNQKSLASPAAQKTILAALQQHIPTLTKIAFSFQEANTENKAPTTKQRAPAQTNTAPKPTNDPVVNALQDKLQATLISQTAIETETN